MDNSNVNIINLDNINIEPHYVNIDNINIPPKPIVISNEYITPIYVEPNIPPPRPPISLRRSSSSSLPYYDYDIIHELQECYSVAIERCSFPCCLFSILSLCIGCVNILSMICNCNYCIKLEIKIGLNIIIKFCILFSIFIMFILCILFIIYGIKNPIYYNSDGLTYSDGLVQSSNNFNSNVWIIIESASNIIYYTYILLSYANIFFSLDKQKKNKILNVSIILCKIIWTFLGLLFIVNNNINNMTYTLILMNIIIVNIYHFSIIIYHTINYIIN